VIVQYLLKIALLGSSWVLYLLLVLSVLSIGAMAERWWYFRKRSDGEDELGEKLVDCLAKGDTAGAEKLLAASPTIEAELLRSTIRWASGGPDALAAAVESALHKKRKELERGMTLLGTLGNNAPFIGLLGTVIGVIVAFADLADGQNKVAMDRVMGGIAEALVATGVGLFVAIPAVIAYNIFQKKIGDVEENVRGLATQLGAFLSAEHYRRTGTGPKQNGEGDAPTALTKAAESVRELGDKSSRDLEGDFGEVGE
jgi:biopolymer transport protein ExbB/biopolymer transport protein TolQ